MTKTYLVILGLIALVMGIAGAISGGHDHLLMGFGINANHHIVHIMTGIIALAGSLLSEPAARRVSQIIAVAYGIVWLAGLAGAWGLVSRMNLHTADHSGCTSRSRLRRRGLAGGLPARCRLAASHRPAPRLGDR